MKTLCPIIFALILIASTAFGGTLVQGPLMNADGTSQNGYLLVSWNTFISPNSSVIGANQLKVAVVNGQVSINLEPGAYTVEYHAGTLRREHWMVPASDGPVNLADVITAVLPTPIPTLPLSQLSTAGAQLGQVIGFDGHKWGPANAGASGILGAPPAWPDFAPVATSGSYTDLLDKPAIPSTTSEILEGSNLYFTDTRARAAMNGLYQTPIAGAPSTWPAMPAPQVNSDWNASSGLAMILNKPVIPSTTSQIAEGTNLYYTDTRVLSAMSGRYQAPIAGAPATWPSFASVATSGDYASLTNKPTIPAAQVNSDWNASSGLAQILNKPALSTVAISGSYSDLLNKPIIPAAQVNADWNAVSGAAQILNKPAIPSTTTQISEGTNLYFTAPRVLSAMVGLYQAPITGAPGTWPSFATVATTGSFTDLSNKPTIPSTTSQISEGTNQYFTTARAQAAMAGLYQGPLGFTAENAANKGAVNGYAPLDGAGKVPAANLPSTAGMTAVVQDSVPQLGGDLDMNSHKIQTVTPTEMSYLHGVTSSIQTQMAGKQATITGAPGTWPSFAVVATSGSYNDLANKPAIPAAQVNSDWSAASGVAQILNKPTIPSSTSQISEGTNLYFTAPRVLTAMSGLYQAPISGAPGAWPTFATVATSGSYNDLANKPTIPAAQVNSDWTAVSGAAQILNKPTTWAWGSLSGVPSSFTPSLHAATHQYGGSDLIGTATPAANAIPMAGSGGTLAAGWMPALSGAFSTTAGSTVATLAAKYYVHQAGFMLGSDATGSPALTDGTPQGDVWVNELGVGIHISKVWCSSNTGTPVINLIKAGSGINLLSSNLTCSTTGGSTTTFNTGTSEDAYAANTRMNMTLITASTATRVTVYWQYTTDGSGQ